jgi:hypothetical protein
MLRTMTFVVLMIVTIGNAWSDPPQSVSRFPGLRYYNPTSPDDVINPHIFATVPEPIRRRVFAHLQRRLGGDFYRRLEFSGGQVVDVGKFRRTNPGFPWEVPAYDLLFTFHMPEIGLDSYTAEIQLRSDGTVLKEIDLPDFAAYPGKIQFTTLASALQTATAEGFDPNKVSAQIEYDSNADVLMWRLSEATHADNSAIQFKNIDIRIDSGKVAKAFNTVLVH